LLLAVIFSPTFGNKVSGTRLVRIDRLPSLRVGTGCAVASPDAALEPGCGFAEGRFRWCVAALGLDAVERFPFKVFVAVSVCRVEEVAVDIREAGFGHQDRGVLPSKGLGVVHRMSILEAKPPSFEAALGETTLTL
jgi:hypothetical protein